MLEAARTRSSARKVPRLRIAIEKTNRNALLGMTNLGRFSLAWLRYAGLVLSFAAFSSSFRAAMVRAV